MNSNNRKRQLQRINKFFKLSNEHLTSIENQIITPINIYRPKVGEKVNITYTQKTITNTIECTVIGYQGKETRKFIILLSKHNVLMKVPLFVKDLKLTITATGKYSVTKTRRAKLYHLIPK